MVPYARAISRLVVLASLTLHLSACANSDADAVNERVEAWKAKHAKEIAQIRAKVESDHSKPDKPQSPHEEVYGGHFEYFLPPEQRNAIVNVEILRLVSGEVSEEAGNQNLRPFRSQEENDKLTRQSMLLFKAVDDAKIALKNDGVCYNGYGDWMRCM